MKKRRTIASNLPGIYSDRLFLALIRRVSRSVEIIPVASV